MPIYAVTYTYADDSAAARDTHRPAHRAYLSTLSEQGINLVSGPFGADEPAGALLLLRAGSKDEVLALTEKDPFRVEGLVARTDVAEWLPVLGPLADSFGTS
ncbi:YciI family protein [Streptomyces albidoflavus]|uniref:YciI family protein n=1 Tax=Streptomyces albidoflavus TaxID=1886 RepID=UPI00340B7D84